MGTIIACIGCYCCLLGIRPKYIELIALIANVIEIGFLIWGAAGIPWGDLNSGGKACYFITCALIIITFILTIILMVLRCKGHINSSSNKTGYGICLTTVIIDVIAFIMIVISEAVILYKMWDLDDDYEYWRGRRYYYSKGYFSDAEWAAAIVPMSVAEICLIAHFYCLSFLLKLIKLKTDLSYIEYNESQTNNSSGNILSSSANYVTPGTTINVYNTPPPPNNQQVLSFIGYDNQGHPIYAGNNQYRSVNYPANTQPNINQNNNVQAINNINNNKINNINNNKINNINNNKNNKINNVNDQTKNEQKNNNSTFDDNDDNIK